MKSRLPALVLLAIATIAAACGDSGSDERPAGTGPTDVIAFGAEAAAGHGLYVVAADGSQLLMLVSETTAVSFPVWSPAGDRLAYVVGAGEQEGPATLRVFDFADGSSATVSEQALAGPLGPAASWSADGRRLAFAEAAAGGRLRIYDVARSAFADMGDVSGVTPDWSPAGDEIALVRSNASTNESDLYLFDADGGDLRQLLQRPGIEGDPRWSPDGRLLSFWSAPAGEPELRGLLVLTVESGRLIEMGSGFSAAWSPDGDRLTYAAPADDPTNLDIFLVSADGTDRRPVSQSVTRDVGATWSPDGTRIAYLAQADRQTAFICVVRLAPEERDCLDLPGLLPAVPAWSPQ